MPDEEKRLRNVERIKRRYHSDASVRELTKERASRWNRENRDKRLVIEHRMRDKRPEQYLVHSTKSGAKSRGLVNTLKPEDLFIPETCPVFKVPLVFGTAYAPSVDRIDNSKGYTPDNIQIISRKANMMKHNASRDELRMFAEWILNESR